MNDRLIDRLMGAADNALRVVTGSSRASNPMPAAASSPPMTAEDRRMSAALLRVDHVGEVCAQALYEGQALAARSPDLRAHMQAAAREETDHLAWTARRLRELDARPSLLNPLWYAGAFAIGWAAGRAGERWSLGFVVETERQVEEHLNGHIERLPENDTSSRAIVARMRDDEIRHAQAATEAGGAPLPLPVRWAMRAAAKVMTTTAHYL